MKVYNYDSNGYYLGAEDCEPSPLSMGQYIVPANATIIQPPSCGENEYPKWNGNEWVKIPNYSGKEYYNKQTRQTKRFELGEEFDSDYTDKKPLDRELYQKFENNEWVIDSIAKAEAEKQKRIAEIKQQLNELDIKTIRPLRAGETEYVNQLEISAQILRAELTQLQGN